MGNNVTPYSIAIGDENVHFLTQLFEFIKRVRIDYSKLLDTEEISINPFDYRVSICGKESFKKLLIYKIHSNYD